jgi:hypothetical protein
MVCLLISARSFSASAALADFLVEIDLPSLIREGGARPAAFGIRRQSCGCANASRSDKPDVNIAKLPELLKR